MLLRRFTDFVLRSRLHAMGTAFVFSLIPLFGASLGILIAAFITLRKGAFEGTLILCATIAPFVLSYAVMPSTNQPQIMMVATLTLIAINILTWLIALTLKRYNNWNVVIEVSMLIGFILIALIYWMFPDIQNWWNKELTAYLNKTASVFEQYVPDSASRPEVLQANKIASIKQYITGFIIASIIFNAWLQLIIARWWQAIIFNPGGLKKELYEIRLGYVAAIVFIAVLAFAYSGNVFSLDLMPIMLIAFCASGLSVIHFALSKYKMGWAGLVLIYAAIFFIFPIGVILVSMLGLLDSLFNIRQRMERRSG